MIGWPHDSGISGWSKYSAYLAAFSSWRAHSTLRLGRSNFNTSYIFYTNILRTSAMSSTNFGSILIFASCVVGTRNILCG